MSQSIEITMKPSIFEKTRLLKIEPDVLEYDYANSSITNSNKFSKFEIAEFRYGIKAIRGYKFVIGRIYCIDVKSVSGKIIKIRQKSLYRINKNKHEEKYKIIIQALYDNYFNDIYYSYIEDFNNRKSITLLNTTITQDGIEFSADKNLIYWNDVNTKRYWHYFTIFSARDANHYKAYEYRTDWNAMILYHLVTNIAEHKNQLKPYHRFSFT